MLTAPRISKLNPREWLARHTSGSMVAAPNIGDPCQAEGCGFELYEVAGDDMVEAFAFFQPTFRSPSLPARVREGTAPSRRRNYLICPRCDRYALGAELVKGYPIRSAAGTVTDVTQMAAELDARSS